MVLTVVFFTVAFLIRTITTILQLANIMTVNNMGEFQSIQWEFFLTVFGEMVPLFYFVYQHIKNLSGEEEPTVAEVDRKLALSARGDTSPSSATTSHPETVIVGMLDANVSSRKSSASSKHNQ